MSSAWEVTDEDVRTVLDRMGMSSDEGMVERVLSNLDMDAVEKAALHGDDMSDQIDYAYVEIEDQIIGMGLD